MTDRKDDLLKALLGKLGAKVIEVDPRNDNEENPLVIIHDSASRELAEELRSYLAKRQPKVSKMTAFATLAYLLAFELYRSSGSTEEACTISTDFERYIHQSVHALWEEFGHPSSLDKKP